MTISKISNSIKNSKHKPGLIPFIVSGYPDMETTKELLNSFQDFGVAAIELGIPFSDPLADGPVIQEAAKHALDGGVTIDSIFNMLLEVKNNIVTPIILFSYINPILSYGIEKFIVKAKEHNISGLIIPDLPLEECEEISKLCKKNDIDLIMLVSPTSDKERIKTISRASSGFIYLVSSTGVTGVREGFSKALNELIIKIKSTTKTPIAVGFGVSKPEHIENLNKIGADGAIIGSAFIKIITENKENKAILLEKVSEYLNSLYSNKMPC